MNNVVSYCVELFKCVPAKDTNAMHQVNTDYGVIIRPEAAWATREIIDFYRLQHMTIEDFNQSFHKSWKVIRESTDLDLAIQQLMHYVTNYMGESTNVYIPEETFYINQKVGLTMDCIKGITEVTLLKKVSAALNGVALTQGTIEKLLAIYDAYGDLSDLTRVLNKEAAVLLADRYGVIPRRPEEVLRLAVYKSTGNTLMIKNDETINQIKASDYNPAELFHKANLSSMSSIFYRFKPLFLAFKPKCGPIINQIRRLAKINHKPFNTNPLDMIMWGLLKESDVTEMTPMSKLLSAYIATCLPDSEPVRLYRVRNGSSFVKMKKTNRYSPLVVEHNRKMLAKILKKRLSHLEGKTILLNKEVTYAIPTSGKKFIGNLPEGSSVSGTNLMIGIYWRNDWGARDLDISAIDLKGNTFSWNSIQRGDVFFSGDMTTAPNGASEFLNFKDSDTAYIISNNVYDGEPTSEFNLILGDRESYNVGANNVIDGDDLITAQHTKCSGRQTTLGIYVPGKECNKIFLTNTTIGRSMVATHNEITENSLRALTAYFRELPALTDLLDDLNIKHVVELSEELEGEDIIDMSVPSVSDFIELLNL